MTYLQLLHQNAPAHKTNQLKDYLTSKRVTVLLDPPYSSDLAPLTCFNPKWHKKILTGRNYSYKMPVGFAVYQCLKSAPKSDYIGAFQIWIKRLKICIHVKGGCIKRMYHTKRSIVSILQIYSPSDNTYRTPLVFIDINIKALTTSRCYRRQDYWNKYQGFL